MHKIMAQTSTTHRAFDASLYRQPVTRVASRYILFFSRGRVGKCVSWRVVVAADASAHLMSDVPAEYMFLFHCNIRLKHLSLAARGFWCRHRMQHLKNKHHASWRETLKLFWIGQSLDRLQSSGSLVSDEALRAAVHTHTRCCTEFIISQTRNKGAQRMTAATTFSHLSQLTT